MKNAIKLDSKIRSWFVILGITALLAGCSAHAQSVKQGDQPRWWKGNLHMHSKWSDGQEFPERAVELYKEAGYHFVSLTDHHRISQGDCWIEPLDKEGKILPQYDDYVKRYGDKWVQTRQADGKLQVRLKPLNEFRHLFEEPGRFCLIQGEEITQSHAHANGINLIETVEKVKSETESGALTYAINAVAEQEKKYGQPMLLIVNHPNWKWHLTAEDILPFREIRFLEVYNSLPSTNTYGEGLRAGTEKVWDILLTKRLAELHFPLLYGVANDDRHSYLDEGSTALRTGRAWIMVRAYHLTPESILEAMNAGDFYSTTGVLLRDVQFDGKSLSIEIQPEKGVSYTTEFIGTLQGYDPSSKPILDENGQEIRATRIYSDTLGQVLSTESGTHVRYTLNGKEIYLRARIRSTKRKERIPHIENEVETAWVQPVLPGRPMNIR